MSLGTEGLIAFVLFVFPGVIARAEAQHVAAIPEDRVARGAVRELADALSYSAFLAPIAGLAAVTVLWATTGTTYGIVDLLVNGLAWVVGKAPIQTLAAALTYLYVAFFLAWWVGGSRRASKVRAWFEDHLMFAQGLVDEPIWWQVFEFRAREYGKNNKWDKTEVFVNIHLTGGGRYTGLLLYFAVAPDTDDKRDIAIWKAHYYPPTPAGDSQIAIDLNPDDVVVVNSRDCIAIEVRYASASGARTPARPQVPAP